MTTWLANFHFLRPLWFLALVPVALLGLWLAKRQSDRGSWQQAIDASLLPYLISVAATKQQRRPWPLICTAWLVGVIALAGPSWQKLPQPVMQQEDALVVVLDLTLSMYATDKTPSRLVHAQHKLADLLQKRKEGLTALVAFSGDAHTVTPLTDDTTTITSMVSALAPDMMPVFGSNATSGVTRAVELLQQAGIGKGRILLMTDEVLPPDIQQIKALLQGRDISLLIMGIGTADGAPIAKPEGGFLKRDDGSIIIAKLNASDLSALAASCNGRYVDSRIDDSDIDYLLSDWHVDTDTRKTEHEFDLWADEGHYLVWLLLPAALLAFRRGALAIILLMLYLPSSPSHAMEWQDFWQRRDQQASVAMQQNHFDEAAGKFDDPAWRAAAQYRAGKFDAAAETLKSQDNATANYNRGNALTQAGKLQDALAAYDRALQQDPNNEDAKINRQLASNALEQQKKQQQQSGDNKQKDPQKDQDKKDGEQKGDQQNGQQQKGQDQSGQQQDGQQQSAQNDSQQSQQQQKDGQSQQQSQQDQQSDKQRAQDASQQNDKQQDQQRQNQTGAEQQKDATAQNASPKSEDEAREHNEQQQNAAKQEQSDDKQKQDEKALQQAIARQQQENKNDADTPSTATQASIAEMPQPQTEQQQALEQWLRRVPDDPGGLMRNKFNYQYRVNEREGKHIQEQEQVW